LLLGSQSKGLGYGTGGRSRARKPYLNQVFVERAELLERACVLGHMLCGMMTIDNFRESRQPSANRPNLKT
jgi:hypothetical protein